MKMSKSRRLRLNIKIAAILAVVVTALGIMIGTYVTQASHMYLTDDRIALIYVWTLLCLYLICSLILPEVRRRPRVRR